MRSGVIITGGAKRVGAALVRYFAQNNYDIALHYSTSKSEAERLQAEVRALGVNCELFALDLSKIEKIPALMADIKTRMPNVTTLINNASIFTRKSFMETDEAFLDAQMTVNFKAPFFLTQAFAKTFGAGSVVNILDTDISKTNGSHFAYLLSKKALADFTQMAARDLGPKIRVNGVCPGHILPSTQVDMDYGDRLLKIIPLKEHPTPELLAEAAYGLAQNRMMTGELIHIDGGMHLL